MTIASATDLALVMPWHRSAVIIARMGAIDGLLGLGLWVFAVIRPFAVGDAHARTREADELRAAVSHLGKRIVFPQLASANNDQLPAAQAPSLNCYCSPPSAGFGMHFDDRSVFILQLEGRKHFRYSVQPALASPPRNLCADP